MRRSSGTHGRTWTDHGVVLLRANGRFDESVPNSTVTAPGGLEGRTYDDITTGSIGYGRHSSAQEGNANQQNCSVHQYGQTWGGPRLPTTETTSGGANPPLPLRLNPDRRRAL